MRTASPGKAARSAVQNGFWLARAANHPQIDGMETIVIAILSLVWIVPLVALAAIAVLAVACTVYENLFQRKSEQQILAERLAAEPEGRHPARIGGLVGAAIVYALTFADIWHDNPEQPDYLALVFGPALFAVFAYQLAKVALNVLIRDHSTGSTKRE